MNYKNLVFYYFTLSFVVILVLNLTMEPVKETVQIPVLGFEDVFTVFSVNTLYMLMGFLLAPLGIPLIMVLKIPFAIGSGPALSNINPFIYYVSSFIHGMAELIAGCILLCFMGNLLYLAIKYINNKASLKSFYQLYVELFMSIIPRLIVILLIGAFVEIYISNVVIRLLI